MMGTPGHSGPLVRAGWRPTPLVVGDLQAGGISTFEAVSVLLTDVLTGGFDNDGQHRSPRPPPWVACRSGWTLLGASGHHIDYYGSEGWGFESLRAHSRKSPGFPPETWAFVFPANLSL